MIYKEIQMTIEISSKISANIPIYNMMMTTGENPQLLGDTERKDDAQYKIKEMMTETLKEKVAETARKKFL